MAKNTSIIGILINIEKAGTGDKQAIASLKGLQNQINQATAIFGTLVAVGYAAGKMFDATAGKFLDYAKNVGDMADAFSLTTEEASRLIQISDDLKISQEDLTKALKQMSSNGIQPSLAGLQMLAEKYAALEDPAVKAKFLTDNFGKSGLEMARAMQKGAEGLQEMNDSVAQNLVLTQQARNEALQYAKNVDDLEDAWSGAAITIGQEVVAALNGLVTAQANVMALGEHQARQVAYLNMAYKDGTLTYEEYIAKATELGIPMQALIYFTEALTQDTIELTQADKELLAVQAALAAGLRGEYSSAYDTYEEKVAEAKEQIAEAKAEMAALAAAGKLTADKQAELNQRIEEGNAALREASALLAETTAQMIYQQAAAGLDARSSLKLARALGLISEADYAIAEAIEELKARRDEEIKLTGDAEAANEKYIQGVERLKNLVAGLPPETVVKVVTQFITTGEPTTGTTDPGTGGGGSGSCFVGNTPIKMADNSQKAIRNVCIGDEVLAFFGGHIVKTEVIEVFIHKAEPRVILKIHMANRKHIEVTPEHSILVNGAWITAGEIRVGMTLNYGGVQFPQVVRIESKVKRVPVYNIHVAHEAHNYFANGFVAHNSDTKGYASGGVSTGPDSGHWELLHGTELVTTPQQFASLMQAASGGGATTISNGGMNLSGATINVTYSGNDFEGLMQSIQSAARRV